ncbi:MAG: HIT domain-containing protein [Helicobacteraceae bacterium]|nr:HIT domain-containing protein [Helicobacteraceae bacterium]
MENILYAPWRDEYVNDKRVKGCVFCHASKHSDRDDELEVLYRDDKCFVVMNKYPYTPGHFMIIPHTHTDKLEDLDPSVWLHMSKLAQQSVKMLKETLHAQGVNIGMNLGKAGGAGIAEHIHMHLVPRWERDTNFMTSVADSRVYSSDFKQIFQKLRDNVHTYFKGA